MPREIHIKIVIDERYNEYDDICDEIMVEDTGIYNNLLPGISIEIVNTPQP